MDAYLKVVQELSKDFNSFELTMIPRGDNMAVETLAVLASTSDPHLRCVIPVEGIDTPSITLPKGLFHITEIDEN